MTRLTDAELTTAKHNLLKGKVSLACESLYLSPEQEAMFQGFEDERLSHEERRARIIAKYTAGKAVQAAE
jgi:hypothetical protein